MAAEMNFGNTLIAGAGPAAVQIAVHLSKGFSRHIALYNRQSQHENMMAEELKGNGNRLELTMQGDNHHILSGSVRIHQLYSNPENIKDHYETLFLCTPCDQYGAVLTALDAAQRRALKTVILISPNIGSNALVGQHVPHAEVISLSSYYGATKWKSGASVTSAYTKALKKRIYAGSSHSDSAMLQQVQQFLKRYGVTVTKVKDPVTAECRNITTYVHPPLFLNDFSLQQILGRGTESKKYMYKLYPEGPITQYVIRSMVRLWKEISQLVESIGAEPINLLQFLNDDNYPVPEQVLSRHDIERFTEFAEDKQEYLLYIRYSSILIDPFSQPDEKGRYFEFSAVPYKKASQQENGLWCVPRIPYEDVQKLRIIHRLGKKAGLMMKEAESLLSCYEQHFQQFVRRHGGGFTHPCPLESSVKDDIEKISLQKVFI
ncbi:opine metallophore biosynthesis dehydrogenase [Fictibacillus iocasae]|uniref:Opine metallophore biosynthesis dehydrogenase n=1 Tax=Fictibacillus iocasae TaxID=2715437 RepID=A0ABW2NRM5_9BACL